MTKTLKTTRPLSLRYCLPVLAAAALSQAAVHAETFVYVSNAADGTISGYQLDSLAGALRPVGTFAAGPAVMPLAQSPNGKYLYAAIRSKPYSVISYRIDASSGRLDPISTAALPESMAYISTDRNGRFLFAASYGGDLVSVNPISPLGVAQGETLQAIKTGRFAHSIVADPSNRFVYVGNLGAQQMLQFNFDERTGTLNKLGTGSVDAPTGSGPRHSVFSPNGKFLYNVAELDGTVTRYSADRATGQLTREESVESAPARFKLEKGLTAAPATPDTVPRIWAADIKISPNGRFLYTSERTSSTITGFGVDAASGKLSVINHVEVEKQPRGFAIDPTGRWLVVSGEKSKEVGLYRIDPNSGELQKQSAVAGGAGANWVEIVETR